MTAYAKIGVDGGPLNDGVVSDWIRRMDLWLEDFQVGQFSVVVDNTGQQAEGVFLPHEAVEIQVDTVTMLKGWVDDTHVHDLPIGSVPTLEIVGRDYSRKLVDLYYSADYSDGLSTICAIIEAVNTAASTGITYVKPDPDTSSTVPYTFSRTYLQEGFKDLCLMADYLYYVDTANALQLFAATDAAASGVTLKSVAAAVDNTILDFRKGESLGFDIRNYIEVDAGDVNDHWTEGNASDYGVSDCTVADDGATYLAGIASIRGTLTGTTAPYIYLGFPLYSYDHLDYSGIGSVDCSVLLRSSAIVGSTRLYIILEDDAALRVYYHPTMDSEPQNTWFKRVFPMGADNEVVVGATPNEWWVAAGSTAFNWADITKLGVYASGASITNQFWVDGLYLNGVSALSIVEDAASQAAYGTRMLPLSKSEITSQIELDAFAASALSKYKDPLQTLHVVNIGDTDLKYTGQTVVVNAPNISSVIYRIQALHVMYGDEVTAEWGFPFVTELELVRQEI